VIPPSIGFVIFGVAANVSITKLFMAGIVPGMMMGLALAVAWWWVARRENVTPPPKAKRAERLRAAQGGVGAGLPVIVIVGLKMGVFTPTEAAVVAAVYALFVGHRHVPRTELAQAAACVRARAKTTSVVMFLVAAGHGVAWLITVANIRPRWRCCSPSWTTRRC
jgi:tripartite ATP-independent transporter DctM subunit